MPTIRELFESKKLNSGQTAQQQYDIQNLKPIPIKTNSGAIDLLASPVNIIRRNFGSRLRETRLEEETQGVRAIRALASPVLYGTAIAKLKLKQSSSVITMKDGANSKLRIEGGIAGIAGQLLNKAKDKVSNFLSAKLGIILPEDQLPTRMAGKINMLAAPVTPEKLAQFKQSGEGNGSGKILAAIGKGATGEQIKNQVLGAGLNAAKKAATKAVFGLVDRVKDTVNAAGGTASVSIRKADTEYTSKRKYTSIIKIRSKQDGPIDDNGNYETLSGLQDYMNTPVLPAIGIFSILASLTKPEGLFIMNKTQKDILTYANPKADIFPEFPEFSLPSITQNLPGKRDLKKEYSVSDTVADFRINNSNKFVIHKDLINHSRPWYSEDGNPQPTSADGKNTLDDVDFIPLRFYSIASSTGVSFKATVTGLSENLSPSWDSNKFIGNPYSFYTYSSIERSVSFNFKVYSLSKYEHVAMWERLNFLSRLVYPQNKWATQYTIPPFLKFTLGNMYKNKECFIESLSYDVDDTTPWEIGIDAEKTGNRISKLANGAIDAKNGPNLSNYKLPTIVGVNVTLKFVETQAQIAGKRLYGFGSDMAADAVTEANVVAFNTGTPESKYGITLAGKVFEKAKTAPTQDKQPSFYEDYNNLF